MKLKWKRQNILFVMLAAGCAAFPPNGEFAPVAGATQSWNGMPRTATGQENTRFMATAASSGIPGRETDTFLFLEDDYPVAHKVVIADLLGHTIEEIHPPEDSILLFNAQGLSPDGKYLVYYTGHFSAWPVENTIPQAPQELMLHILRTKDGVPIFSVSVLPNNYPQNFSLVAKDLLSNPLPGIESDSSEEILATDLWSSFSAGILSFAWSPDGGRIAFAGGMQSDSSDVYVYDMAAGTYARASNEPEEVGSILWSPDGKWILHGDSFYTGEGWNGLWHISPGAGLGSEAPSYRDTIGTARTPWGLGASFHSWISGNQALLFDGENGRGSFGLLLLDVQKQNLRSLWPHTLDEGSFDFDPVANAVMLSSPGEKNSRRNPVEPGTYKIPISVGPPLKITSPLRDITYVGWKDISFAGISPQNDCTESDSCASRPDKPNPAVTSAANENISNAQMCFYSDAWKCIAGSPDDDISNDSLAGSPDHQLLARYGEDGLAIIQEWPAGISPFVNKALTTQPIHHVSWSEDSRFLAFSGDAFFKVYDTHKDIVMDEPNLLPYHLVGWGENS